MVENDVSGSGRMTLGEIARERGALAGSVVAVPREIDPRKEEKAGGQGLIQTLQGLGWVACPRGRPWRYRLLSIWRISTCSLSAWQLIRIDNDSEMNLPIPRRRSLGRREGLRRNWQLRGTFWQ